MADKHPYISSSGALVQVLDYLRKSFPATFNSETLKKLSLAPGNESYILNILRFLGLLSEDDARTNSGQDIFTLHAEAEFQKGFGKAVETAYADLFSLHHAGTWTLGDDKLIPYFRQTDKTSQIVGARQASTFRTLSAYSGHETATPASRPGRAQVKVKNNAVKKIVKPIVQDPSSKIGSDSTSGSNSGQRARDLGLTVRIEINLPATGDQDTYDKIFKSIKENFLNA